MLMKLLKHEFHATAHMMGPLYLVMLVLAVGARLLIDDLGDLGELLGGLAILTILACSLVSVAMMVYRFKRNLLGDEGYLMLTLPVSIHQHLWAKMIVSAVWFAVSLVMTFLALMLYVVNDLDELDFYLTYGSFVKVGGTSLSLSMPSVQLLVLEMLVLVFVAVCTVCLQFYAALAVGHSFSHHKMTLSVVSFVVLSLAASVLTELMPSPDLEFRSSYLAELHLAIWLIILGTAVIGALNYAVTAWFLKYRLNLG